MEGSVPAGRRPVGPLRVALVTPFDWGIPSAVNQHVADLARYLARVGHRPTIIGASSYVPEGRRMRPLLRKRLPLAFPRLEAWGSGAPAAPELLPTQGLGPISPDEGIPVLTIGKAVPLRLQGAVVSVSLPVDVTSRLERLLAAGLFDVVHVHEPAAPSLSFSAVALARCPVVATFHLTTAGLFSYEHSRPFLQRSLERVDRRLVPSERAAVLLRDFLGGEYHVAPLPSALRAGESGRVGQDGEGKSDPTSAALDGAKLLFVYRGDERRGLALLLRTLARRRDWGPADLTVAVHRASGHVWPPRAVPRRLSGTVTWLQFDSVSELSELVGEAAALVLPVLGGDWLQMALEEAKAAHVPALAPDLPICRDILGAGGIYFSPDQEGSLVAAVQQALERARSADARPRPDLDVVTEVGGVARHGRNWAAAGPELVEQYERVLVGRAPSHDAAAHAPARRRGAASVTGWRARRGATPVRDETGRIHVDLHVHTAYSKDSASSVTSVLRAAVDVGLGAIAIADHNTIAGALVARRLAGDELFVIVAEEIKTRQGEVIGLFLEEEIPAGLDFDETLGLIKAQGALVYVPHPFDGLHSTPSYRLLADNVHRIDALEVFNARLAVPAFNVRAERFAAKYNIAAGAGSDAHVVQGLGTAMVRMEPFSTPEEFLRSLRNADILAARKSVLYLTSLKVLQTSLDRVRPTPNR